MSELSLHELVDRCIAGDEVAWRAFVDRHSRLVYSIPKRNRFDDAACDDIFQDVFLAAYNNLHSLRDAQSVPKWLITTTTRLCAKFARKYHRSLGPQEQEAPTEPEMERQENLHTLHLALDELGGRCRELLLTLYGRTSGLGYDDIAVELEMPRGSIGPTRQRCLEKLTRILAEMRTPDQE